MSSFRILELSKDIKRHLCNIGTETTLLHEAFAEIKEINDRSTTTQDIPKLQGPFWIWEYVLSSELRTIRTSKKLSPDNPYWLNQKDIIWSRKIGEPVWFNEDNIPCDGYGVVRT